MSETGSFRSTSPKELEINTVPDEVLDDHRHQTSLPVRVVPDDSTIDDDDPRAPPTYHNDIDPKDYEYGPIPIVRGSGGSLAAAARRGRTSKNRSHSFSEQIRCLANPKEQKEKEQKEKEQTQGILRNPMDKAQNPSVNPSVNPGVNPSFNPNFVVTSDDGWGGQTDRSKTEKTEKSLRKLVANLIPHNLTPHHNSPEPSFPVLPKKYKRSGSIVEQNLARVRSGEERERRPLRSSIDSEDSQALRSSQETEEDVCFPPMLREHVRIKGIDFDEIEEFIKEERESSRLMFEQQHMIAEQTKMRILDGRPEGVSSLRSVRSSAALKYTPKNILNRFKGASAERSPSIKTALDGPGSSQSSMGEKDDSPIQFDDDDVSEAYGGIRFGGARITEPTDLSLPDRFSFFSSESEETVHAPDLPSLVAPGQSVRELFRNGESTWWLDCVCPTDAEMKTLARAFGIHPLTAEDIRMQETREKVELFRNYYFVCFHTFEPDKESEDYLEPINVYLVVFRDGVLSFHFSPMSHPASVRRRVRQLRDYVDVSADWICYAMIDDITDEFAPVITGIEYEADAIEDSVFVARDTDFSSMLQRIGESRKKVMTLMRLLSGKADVIKMFAKRCQEEAGKQEHPIGFNEDGTGGISFGTDTGVFKQQQPPQQPRPVVHEAGGRAQPRADIALYLGDIQDHVVTMFQNLLAYEKIFSRSHSNYLAQLQVESFNSNNRVTEMFSKVTLIGTILVPLNLVTGLFGMNVHVPGEGGSTLQWFFGIVGFMVFMTIVSFVGAKMWIDSALNQGAPPPESLRKSIRSFGMRRTRDAARSVLSFPNKYD